MFFRFGCNRETLLSTGVSLVLIVGLTAMPAPGVMQSVADEFRVGNYTTARSLLDAGEWSARPGEEILWRSRLLSNPEQALALLQDALGSSNLPETVRLRVALEIAELECARGQYRAALVPLNRIFSEEAIELPGAIYLQAGYAYRGLGALQKAREMLASIRPDDPAFVLARNTLGDIGLQQDDYSLALRYFQSATTGDPAGSESLQAAGLWEAYRRTGDQEQADRLVEQLRTRQPGSLALLEINRVLRTEREDLEARLATNSTQVDSVINRVENTDGRYCLQLGAFSDRGLALAFQQQFLDKVPDLRIEQVRDSRGQFLYKIRLGSFVNPALANTEAKRLARKLDVEVIVADLAK
ncbi:MAG: SPOR domain-containing protein [Gemmatimonadales bacterium]|nr:SPOR domain-containing protein [Gemmatimonadales bacterium]